MVSKVQKQTAIAALLWDLFWRPFNRSITFLQFVVSGAAVAVLLHAGMRRCGWMGLFLVAACLFNPALPPGFSRQISMVVSALTAVLFLHLLQPKPRLSVASITDRMPESQSL